MTRAGDCVIISFASGQGPASRPAYGGVAQLGERLLRMQEARGSNPLISTKNREVLLDLSVFMCIMGFEGSGSEWRAGGTPEPRAGPPAGGRIPSSPPEKDCYLNKIAILFCAMKSLETRDYRSLYSHLVPQVKYSCQAGILYYHNTASVAQ